MSRDVYRELQQYLDKMSLGFPPTKSGIEIEILKSLFSEDEAILFLSMTQKLETPEDLAARLGRDPVQLANQLKDMRDRGLLFSMKKGDSTRYSTVQFVHGVLEFQVDKMSKKLSQMYEDYFKEAFGEAVLFSTPTFMRTIPIKESLDTKHSIAVFNDPTELFKDQPLISVANCFCRKQQMALGKEIKKPMETCFFFGAMAKYYIDNNLGRQVTADEAIRIIEEAKKAGLVTQAAAALHPAAVCSCDESCMVIRALNLSDKPAEHVTANYQSQIVEEECVGCEVCIESCHMHAISMKDNVAEINPDRCIGCGLCVMACAPGAIRMALKTEQPEIPPTLLEQMQMMAKARATKKEKK